MDKWMILPNSHVQAMAYGYLVLFWMVWTFKTSHCEIFEASDSDYLSLEWYYDFNLVAELESICGLPDCASRQIF